MTLDQKTLEHRMRLGQMELEKVIAMLEERITFYPSDSPYIERIRTTLELVQTGQMIHIDDVRWSWEDAFPVIAQFKIDGWEFTLRKHNELFMHPGGRGLPSLTAELVAFEKRYAILNKRGLCIDCGCWVDTGTITLISPSNRTFPANYRDYCDCYLHGQKTGEIRAQIVHEGTRAADILASYMNDTTDLQDAVFTWLKKSPGSIKALKKIARRMKPKS